MKKNLAQIMMMAAFAVPLQQDKWTELSFNKIPPNTVTFTKGQIQVKVNKSAGPLIYKIEKSALLSGFEVQLLVTGAPKLLPGNEFEEDSCFRIGLVAEGDKTLSGVKKLFAPDWVKKLFALVPEGIGLDKIYFFNVTSDKQILGTRRVHPKSDLMSEEVTLLRKTEESSLHVLKTLSAPQKISALWISIDGDDTQSEYQTTIEKISLTTL